MNDTTKNIFGNQHFGLRKLSTENGKLAGKARTAFGNYKIENKMETNSVSKHSTKNGVSDTKF